MMRENREGLMVTCFLLSAANVDTQAFPGFQNREKKFQNRENEPCFHLFFC